MKSIEMIGVAYTWLLTALVFMRTSMRSIEKIVYLTLTYVGLLVAICVWLAFVWAGFRLALVTPDYQFDTVPTIYDRAGHFILAVVLLMFPFLGMLSDIDEE